MTRHRSEHFTRINAGGFPHSPVGWVLPSPCHRWGSCAQGGWAPTARAENSLLLLSPEVGFDDQAVQGEVQHERPHGGIEDGTGQQLVCQVNGEEVGLTGPI